MGAGKLTWTIGKIIAEHPETRDIFVRNGFPALADDGVLANLGPVLTLKTALKSKTINEAVFLRLLEAKIVEKRIYQGMEATVIQQEGRLNILTLIPCPLKVPLQEELTRFFDALKEQTGMTLNYSIDISANKHLDGGEYSKYFTVAEELPDVILTTGFDFLYKTFIDRFITTGVFLPAACQQVNSRLAAAKLTEADSPFTVIAVNTLVMVVDKKRLGKLPLPRTWRDLLDPLYEKQVVIRGQGDIFCDVVQLNYYKDYGDEGIKGLAKAVRYGLHPAQMVKELASSRLDVPPIHIMPRFFAETIVNRKQIEIIWPEDGALTYPISLLVKADKREELKPVVDFLIGAEVARIFDEAWFPALHPTAGGKLPADATFKWVGWDYVKQKDMEVLTGELNERFLQAFQPGGHL
jgi:ABC-type Fe3+ transport system substrate-binding protein